MIKEPSCGSQQILHLFEVQSIAVRRSNAQMKKSEKELTAGVLGKKINNALKVRRNKRECKVSRESSSSGHEQYKNKEITMSLKDLDDSQSLESKTGKDVLDMSLKYTPVTQNLLYLIFFNA